MENKKKRRDGKTSLYKPDAAKAMADFRYKLSGALDGPKSYMLLKMAITKYRRSIGDNTTVTPKYIYTSINILREFTKNINFDGKCELLFNDYENPAYKEFNPYISQIMKRLGLSLTTLKAHLKAIKGAGVMTFEKIEGQRAKLKRLNPIFLDAIGLLGLYEQLVFSTEKERQSLKTSLNNMRKTIVKARDKLVVTDIEPNTTLLSAQDDSPDILF